MTANEKNTILDARIKWLRIKNNAWDIVKNSHGKDDYDVFVRNYNAAFASFAALDDLCRALKLL